MKKPFTVEFWYMQNLLQAVISEKLIQSIREYHFTLASEAIFENEGYFFIQCYDGSLQLNKTISDFRKMDFLEEMATAIQNHLNYIQSEITDENSPVNNSEFFPFTNIEPNTPSAAA